MVDPGPRNEGSLRECLFWQAILDLEPPLARRGDLGSHSEAEGG